jgi:hypothetical protein
MSLEKTLCAEVESDLCSLPLSRWGSLTILWDIIKRLVIKNQEARDALEVYLKTFDIRKFPGENVPLACLCLKAVTTSLGSDNLLTNVIHKLLESFAKSAMISFNEVCTSQLALRHGSISQKLFKDTSLHTQLIKALNDLESVYLDLVGGKLWAGVNTTPQASSFKAALANGDDANAVMLAAVKHMPADVKECALAAVKTLPWKEWVKLYARCHHCGEKEHIHLMCPKYLAAIQSGEINPKHPCNIHNMRKKPPVRQLPGKIGNHKQPPQNLKDLKAKAFLSAFQALFQALLQMKRPARMTMMRRTRTPLDQMIAMSMMTTTIYMGSFPWLGLQKIRLTCINCSVVPLIVTSNSGHCFTTDIISTLLFGDALSCFQGGSSSIQVANYVRKSQLFGNVFSNLNVGPLYLFPCLMSCCSGNVFFNPR